MITQFANPSFAHSSYSIPSSVTFYTHLVCGLCDEYCCPKCTPSDTDLSDDFYCPKCVDEWLLFN